MFRLNFRICLSECHQAYYLYDGQCFPGCPEKTFPSQSFISRIAAKPLVVDNSPNTSGSASLRRKRGRKTKRQPANSVRNVMRPQQPKICLNCHYSCLNCSGPYDYQCTKCPEDAQLVFTHDGNIDERYCYPKHLMTELETSIWLHRFYLFFGIISFVSVCVLLYFAISKLMMSCSNKPIPKGQKSKSQEAIGYNRLSTDSQTNVDIGKEINNAIFDDSDSDGSV